MKEIKEITLRSHQIEMLEAAKQHSKGIIQSPTGSGKTFAQSAIVEDFYNTNKGFSVVLVKASRISLINQVAGEYTEYLVSKGIEPQSILIHSGKAEPSYGDEVDLATLKLNSYFPNATSSINELNKVVGEAMKQDIPLIIYVTYHSNLKVLDALGNLGINSIDLDINDEAHNLVQERHSKILTYDIKYKRQYFFTATPRVTESDEGKGMNNGDLFGNGGENIYQMPILESIKKEFVLPIQAYYERPTGVFNQDEFDAKVGECISTTFYNLVEHFNQDKGLAAKLLVTVRNSTQIGSFLDSDEYLQLRSNNVEVLTVHSNDELITYNGDPISRNKFDKLKSTLGEDPNVSLIIIHYDILSEGIDVPGLNGVLILRKMSVGKFFQTIGRVMRLYRPNPSLKQYGILFFPTGVDNDMSHNFEENIREMYREGYIPNDEINNELNGGLPEDDDDRDQREINFRDNAVVVSEDLGLILEPLVEEKKLKELNSLTFGELLNQTIPTDSSKQKFNLSI